MGIIFWICTISIVCTITGVIFYKPYLGIVFVIVSIPFEGKINSDYFSIYPLETILAILIFICIYKLIVRRENCFRNTKLVFFCLPFIFCLFLSSLKSMELSLAIKEIVRWLELFVVYYLTINLVNDDKKIRVIMYTMVLTTVIVSICGIVSYLAGVADLYKGRPGIYVFFGHPNVLAGYVNLIIPVLFGMLMTSAFLWERITLCAFTVLSTMAWFLAFSRSAWLSLILTMIPFFFMAKGKRRAISLSVMFFAIFAVIFLFLTSNVKDNLVERLLSENATLENRFLSYSIGLDMVKNNLIFGIGTGNYPLLIKKFTSSMDPYSVNFFIRNDLHNLYLQIFVTTGLMGLCTFAFWLTGIIKYLMSALKSLEKSRNYGLLVGLMGGVIVYLINNFANVLTVHGIHLQWGVILGLAVVLTQNKESETCLKTV